MARKKDTPSALISGAILGAFRKGRYAKRSTTMPSAPAPSIPPANINRISGTSATAGARGPPRTLRIPYPRNAPTM